VARRRANCSATHKNCCAKIIDKKLLTAQAVYGFYPANSDGDDIILYSDPTRTETLTRLHTLRQQKVNSSGKPQLALGRLHRAQGKRSDRYIGAFAGDRRARLSGTG
jgi:5-methyltetrahydrofolate--homocysteine methyltransferase